MKKVIKLFFIISLYAMPSDVLSMATDLESEETVYKDETFIFDQPVASENIKASNDSQQIDQTETDADEFCSLIVPDEES